MAYQWWFVKKPIEEVFNSVDGLQVKQMTVTMQEVQLELMIDPTKYVVPEQFPSVRQEISKVAGNRVLTISFVENVSPGLKVAWQEAMFGVKEGLKQGAYTKIQQTIQQKAHQYGLNAQISMDDEYVYIQMTDGTHFVVQLFPIINDGSEVKTSA